VGGIFIVKIFEASIFLLRDPALPDNLSTAQASKTKSSMLHWQWERLNINAGTCSAKNY